MLYIWIKSPSLVLFDLFSLSIFEMTGDCKLNENRQFSPQILKRKFKELTKSAATDKVKMASVYFREIIISNFSFH